MSPDFLSFLGDYNTCRKQHGLPEADDWFSFSVPEMFRRETEREAWKYWRWRMLRALVEPASDYVALMKLIDYFGRENVFVQTSNCDMLHERAGMSADAVYEIHGSLGRLQCADECCDTLYPADTAFLERLEANPNLVPRCPHCASCLRPNVMIFGDDKLVYSEIGRQKDNFSAFKEKFDGNWLVIEVGAGVVVPSIRFEAEDLAARADGANGGGLIRVNPSAAECETMQTRFNPCPDQTTCQCTSCKLLRQYYPIVARSTAALEGLVNELGLQ
jgi:NAD-dependent SIR2 family protein deacetylase